MAHVNYVVNYVIVKGTYTNSVQLDKLDGIRQVKVTGDKQENDIWWYQIYIFT